MIVDGVSAVRCTKVGATLRRDLAGVPLMESWRSMVAEGLEMALLCREPEG
jgi:hypothetical protein